LRRRADDVAARALDSAAILFTVLTLSLQIRHYIYGGDLTVDPPELAELGLQAAALLAVAIGLERVRGRTQNPVHDLGAMIVAGLALALAMSLIFQSNPLFSDDAIEGLVFNAVLLAYGTPALLAIVLALIAKNTRPLWYRGTAAATAVTLALTYLTLQVRRFYQGPVLEFGNATSDAELWTYSIVWLVFGVTLLVIGLLLRSQPARLASAAVILLTVLKVFLFDLAGIGGVWRALSFIGLGLVLVGIGWLYQRLLFPRPAPTVSASAAGPPAAEAPSIV
jgi:uncharacterized membrane protein